MKILQVALSDKRRDFLDGQAIVFLKQGGGFLESGPGHVFRKRLVHDFAEQG